MDHTFQTNCSRHPPKPCFRGCFWVPIERPPDGPQTGLKTPKADSWRGWKMAHIGSSGADPNNGYKLWWQQNNRESCHAAGRMHWPAHFRAAVGVTPKTLFLGPKFGSNRAPARWPTNWAQTPKADIELARRRTSATQQAPDVDSFAEKNKNRLKRGREKTASFGTTFPLPCIWLVQQRRLSAGPCVRPGQEHCGPHF